MTFHLPHPGGIPATTHTVDNCPDCGRPRIIVSCDHSQDVHITHAHVTAEDTDGTDEPSYASSDQPDDEQPTTQLVVARRIEHDVTRVNEILHMQQADRMPLLAMGAVGAAGWLAHLGAEHAATPAGQAAVATTTLVVTAISLPALRIRFRNSIPERWRRRWWLAGALGCGWINAAAAPWPDMVWLTGGGALVGFLLARPWWAECEIPHPNEVVDLDPTPALEAAPIRRELEPAPVPRQLEPAPVVDPIQQAWDEAAASDVAAVPRGAQLLNRVDLPGGSFQYTVQLDPRAGVGATALCAQLAAIALIFRLPLSAVYLEPGESEDLALLTIAPQGPASLELGTTYPGPDYKDGRVPVAWDVTGRRRDIVAYERGQGVASGLVVGDQRSGKTGVLELLGLGLRKSGIWRVWFGDGDKAGASSNLLLDGGVAQWPENTPEGLLRQLCGYEELLESRAEQKKLLTEDPVTGFPVPRLSLSQPPINEFPPCPDFPGYMWLIPELFQVMGHELLVAHDFGNRLDALLRRAPKFGLGVFADTQSTAGADFGGLASLRAWLQRVNAFVMRTTNQEDRWAITGLQGDPGTLRRGGGWGFSAGHDGDGVPLRTMWQDDLHKWVPTLPAPCPDDPEAAHAIAPFLPAADTDGDPDGALETYRESLERWRNRVRERAASGDADAAASATLGRDVDFGRLDDIAELVAHHDLAVSAALLATGEEPPLGKNVIPMPTRPAAPAAPAPTTVPQDLGPLSDRERQVLDVLRSRRGRFVSAQILKATGLPAPAVTETVKRLHQRGLVDRAWGWAEAVPVADGPFAWSPETGDSPAVTNDSNEESTSAMPPAAAQPSTPATAGSSAATLRDWTALKACRGCRVEPGADHQPNCAHAKCPECAGSSCIEHAGAGRPARWHGIDPAVEIAVALGWWIRLSELGQVPDTVRVLDAQDSGELVWDRATQRYTEPAAPQNRVSTG